MKTFFAAGLMAFTQAAAHEYFAESNFICGICQDAVKMAADEAFDELEKLYEVFPALEKKIESFMGAHDLIDLHNPEKTCQNFNLCEKESFLSFIYNEATLDLESIVSDVNSNPNSTWTATTNAKFEGATRN